MRPGSNDRSRLGRPLAARSAGPGLTCGGPRRPAARAATVFIRVVMALTSTGLPPFGVSSERCQRSELTNRLSDLSPAGFAQSVDAEDDQAERGYEYQDLTERLIAQREQRPVDPARLGRLVRDRRLNHQDADQGDDRAAGDGPDHAEPLDDPARPRAHLP